MKQTLIIFCSFAFLASGHLDASPKKKTAPVPVPDKIDVLARVPIDNGSVVRMATSVHWRRNLLYVEQGNGRSIAVFDVTNPKQPKAITEFVPQLNTSVHLTAVVGNAALLTSSVPENNVVPQTVTIMSFAETPARVVRQFDGVTSLLKDQGRSLIYLANKEGVWVLREIPGEDLEQEKEYDEYLRGLQ